MKICILGENGSVHVQKWIGAIAQTEGIELHVISFNRGHQYDGVFYHDLKKITGSKLDFFLNLFHAKRLIRKIKPNLVHAHYATSYGLLGAFSGVHPFMITGWGADIFDSPKHVVMKRILRYSFAKADAITVLSKITQQEMVKLSSKKVSLIPFGVDLNKFTVRPTNQTKEIRIGTIRTLSEKYGVEYLIRAFAQLRLKYDHIYLDIVGDGPLRASLTDLCKDLNVENFVTFHGYVNQNTDDEKYLKLLQGMDIFCILSVIDSETFGVAAVEASASGIPVVATRVGGLPEVIDDGSTGLLVAPRSAEETAIALEKLILDQALREKLGEQGRIKVENFYDWKKNVQQMVSIYRELCAGASH